MLTLPLANNKQTYDITQQLDLVLRTLVYVKTRVTPWWGCARQVPSAWVVGRLGTRVMVA